MKNTEKNAQNLERYILIVDYFNENPERILQNRMYLNEIMYDLSKSITSMRFGYPVFKEGGDYFPLVKELHDKINSMLNKAGIYTGISGTGTGTGSFI